MFSISSPNASKIGRVALRSKNVVTIVNSKTGVKSPASDFLKAAFPAIDPGAEAY
jgi:hypothetical protein